MGSRLACGGRSDICGLEWHQAELRAGPRAFSLLPDTVRGRRYYTCYSLSMAVKAIQLGQVWRNNDNGGNFLVTKLYSELFTQYAMLRPADVTAPTAETIRIKVSKTPEGVTLPGYTFTQDLQEF